MSKEEVETDRNHKIAQLVEMEARLELATESLDVNGGNVDSAMSQEVVDETEATELPAETRKIADDAQAVEDGADGSIMKQSTSGKSEWGDEDIADDVALVKPTARGGESEEPPEHAPVPRNGNATDEMDAVNGTPAQLSGFEAANPTLQDTTSHMSTASRNISLVGTPPTMSDVVSATDLDNSVYEEQPASVHGGLDALSTASRPPVSAPNPDVTSVDEELPVSVADATNESSVDEQLPVSVDVPDMSVVQQQPSIDIENPTSTISEDPTVPVTARPVQSQEDSLQAQLRERDEELAAFRREEQDVPVANVILADENDAPVTTYSESATWMERLVRNPKNIVIALLVGVLLVVALVLGIVLTRDEPTEQGDSPAESPTMPPTSPIIMLTEMLANVSSDGGEALQTPATPQNDALIWLAGNANLDSYSDVQMIQRYALATFFYSLNGESWTDNTNWLSDEDECVWYNEADDGPFCTVNGGVRELDFFHNNLEGTIAPEVGLLSNSLVEFGLSDSVTGSLPTEIGQLTTLKSLWLYNIDLTGTIPTEIALMTSLQVAWLFNNSFSGEFTCPDSITQCYVSCVGGEDCRTL